MIYPAGFVINILEGVLQIRPIFVGYEVSWHEIIDGQAVETFKNFVDPLEASVFFVSKRHDLQIGIDFNGIVNE